MSKFTDRLWGELVREHGADLAQTSRPADKRAGWMSPRLLLGSTLGAGGVATALALALGAASSAPAFAVTRNGDGTVTVKVMRVAGIAGANAKLTQLGVRAQVVQVAAGCGAPMGASIHTGPAKLAFAHAQALAQAKITPRKIPAGRTLVIASWRAGRQVGIAPGYMARGVAPACLPPVALKCAAGPPPAGKIGNGGDSGPALGKALSGPALRKALTLRALAKVRTQVPIGESGTSGNSKTSGDGSKSGPPPFRTGPVPGPTSLRVFVPCGFGPPPPGNSGTSGESGKSGS